MGYSKIIQQYLTGKKKKENQITIKSNEILRAQWKLEYKNDQKDQTQDDVVSVPRFRQFTIQMTSVI